MEKRIYSGWAFSEGEGEKAKINIEMYEELKKKYKILIMSGVKFDRLWEEDVVLEYLGTGYGNEKYRIVKNNPNLSNHELALIADKGNLCFGYRIEGNIIVISTD